MLIIHVEIMKTIDGRKMLKKKQNKWDGSCSKRVRAKWFRCVYAMFSPINMESFFNF